MHRRDPEAQRNQSLKMWKLFNLAILQKMRKLVLERKPRVWLDNHYAKSLPKVSSRD